MSTFWLSCGILVAVSVLLLIGGIFGTENVIEGDSSILTYPFRLSFRKKWKTYLYGIAMDVLIAAFSVVFTYWLLSFCGAGEWVAILMPFEVWAVIMLAYYLSHTLYYLLCLLFFIFLFIIYGWQKDK